MLSLFIQNMYLGKASPHRLDPDAEDKVLVKTLNVYLKKFDRAEKAKDGKAEKDDPLANLKIFLATKELKNGKEHALTNFRRMYDVLEDKEKERFIKYLRGVNEDFDLGIDIQGLIDGKARVKPKSRKEAVKNPAHEEKEVFMIEHEPEPPARSPEESKNIYSQAMKDMHHTNVMAIYAKQCLGNLEYVKAQDVGIIDDNYNALEASLGAVADLSDQAKPQEAKAAIDRMLNKVDTFIHDYSHTDNKTLKTICLCLKSFRKAARDYYNENDIRTTEDKTYKQILEAEYPNMMSGIGENEKRRFSILAEDQRKNIRKLLKKVRDNFKVLQDCNRYPDGNSRQFNNMFAAAGIANALTENSTMMEIRKAIGELHATASVYNDKINSQGVFAGQLIVGKKKGYYRHQAAQNLKTVTTDLLFRMDYMTDPYRNLTDQITHPTVQRTNNKKNHHPEIIPGK